VLAYRAPLPPAGVAVFTVKLHTAPRGAGPAAGNNKGHKGNKKCKIHTECSRRAFGEKCMSACRSWW
jgi:hypothetical protein